MKISELKLLKEQLKTGFYKRLINGEIKQAKTTLEFAYRIFRELNKLLPPIISKLEENSEKKINILWNSFKTSFYEFQALAEKELDLTEEIFKEDVETWQELLSGVFKNKIDELCSLLEIINDLLKVQVVINDSAIIVTYDPKYSKQKNKDNLYLQHKKEIKRVELQIVDSLSKNIKNKKGITQKIKTGTWKDYYHAHLPEPMGNHRIVYSWDGKVILFKIIGTHKQLGID